MISHSSSCEQGDGYVDLNKRYGFPPDHLALVGWLELRPSIEYGSKWQKNTAGQEPAATTRSEILAELRPPA